MNGRVPALLTLVLVGACQSGLGGGARCARTSECAHGLACRFGACRPECLSTAECAPGAECLPVVDGSGVCGIDLDLGCEEGAGRTCATGLVCAAGRCRGPCAGEGDCLAEQACVASASGTAFCQSAAGLDAGRADGGVDDAALDAGGGATVREEATLAFQGAAALDFFGQALALSADGQTAIVGAPAVCISTDCRGGARVFVRASGTWTEQASFSMPVEHLGRSVALNDAGDLALIGSEYLGALSISRVGTLWREDETVSLGVDSGPAVALSGDGSIGVLGVSDPAFDGAQVITRAASAWSPDAALPVRPVDLNSEAARVVGLSGDGTVALVADGNDIDYSNPDRFIVFARVGASWTQEAEIVPADTELVDVAGISCALTRDGSLALIGVPHGDAAARGDQGSARVFVRSGGAWREETRLFAADGVAADLFGTSVALSADGSRALIGAPGDDTDAANGAGSAHVFRHDGVGWSDWLTLTAVDGGPSDAFGAAVALSADGRVALVGAPLDDTTLGIDVGTAHVFILP